MSLLIPEQFAAAQTANLDILVGLTNKAYEGFQKVCELNLQAAQSTLAETQENTRKALAAKDLPELLALQAGLMQPAAEKALSYRHHLSDIASDTRAEFAKVAEAQNDAYKRWVEGLVDGAGKSAPAGSEAAVAAMQSALAATNTLFETMQQTAGQVAEIAERSFNSAAAAASTAVQPATAQAAQVAKKP